MATTEGETRRPVSSRRESFRGFVTSHDPLVSVVIPCFRKAEYLPDALRSVADQSWKRLEVIVVDDGGGDDAGSVVGAFRAPPGRDLPVRFVAKPNGGVSETRNRGISEANGRVVVALDADDVMGPGFVEEAVRLMRDEGADLVCSDVELFGAKTGLWVPHDFDELSIRYDNSVPTMAAFDRALWKAVGGYSHALPFNEDWEFFVRCAAAGMKVARIRRPLFRYRVTGSGLAETFITDTAAYGTALVITCNDGLYPVGEVLAAHRTLAGMPERWHERFERQGELQPAEWLPELWSGLAEEGKGAADRAAARYTAAAEKSEERQWQPLVRLAVVSEPPAAARLLRRARVLRPDLPIA